ncbi:phosphotransferase enzyme family protein [Colletotrichum zoysiae]|uniref:Phosphotransferase enzyme family protein n=1 Tax=Colletotrichum zoysiae TaxID=1216348 RepID=A0AAD9H8A4_9PEZI|nr:phosphotransferase enzyme family protein [Colletotrichum zoysiae]
MKIFPESSFFKEKRAHTLPTPAEVRARNWEVDRFRAARVYRPPAVKFPSLGLVVKYGSGVTIVEAQTQVMVHERLRGTVPVPEIFALVEDDKQLFIYMSLIEGATLQERWCDLNEDERRMICGELKEMLRALRTLEQDSHDRFVGNLGKQPVNDVFLLDSLGLRGPFMGACGIDIDGEALIVFTHNDLVAPNIMLLLRRNPKVAAIIDWGQSGWLSAYWEYCKAKWVKLYPTHRFDEAAQEEWHTKYLPNILDPVDDETHWYPWLYFALANI